MLSNFPPPRSSCGGAMKGEATVLCVSEDLYALQELVAALQASGHRILTACSYPRAATLAAAEKIDIVVMAQGNLGRTITCPACLKFVKPEIPILLVSLAGACSNALPTGVDMVAQSVDEISTSVEVLLATDVSLHIE